MEIKSRTSPDATCNLPRSTIYPGIHRWPPDGGTLNLDWDMGEIYGGVIGMSRKTGKELLGQEESYTASTTLDANQHQIEILGFPY